MKRIVLILMLVSFCIFVAYAQESCDKKIIIKKQSVVTPYPDVKILTQQDCENLGLVCQNIGDMQNIEVKVTKSNSGDDGPFMGVFTEDMTLDQAAQKGYHEMYGILITGVSPNTPAQKYKLMVDDILMKIDDNKITNKDQLLKVMQSYAPKDSAQLTVFRNGTQMTIPFVFGSKKGVEQESGAVTVSGSPKKTQHSVGYGGGTWTPIWFMLDMDDVNHIVSSVKVDDEYIGSAFKNISNKGLFFNGGAGKGNVGKGYFIGGMGAGYEVTKTYRDNSGNTHRMNYEASFGGVTLDKRVYIAPHVTGSLGFLLGGGSQTVDVVRQQYTFPDGNYDWTNISTVNLVKDEVKLRRTYLVFQPKAELMYHFLSWLAIRGEVGYMVGSSSQDGWLVANDHNSQVTNSPNTPLSGWTYSIGPWFGF
jgi:hypothetical protein